MDRARDAAQALRADASFTPLSFVSALPYEDPEAASALVADLASVWRQARR